MTMKPCEASQPPLERHFLTTEESLQRMQRAANQFYREAVYANCHSFLELAGLMEELIKIYKYNLACGNDFRDCHAHNGKTLLMESGHLNYINEKLNCIFNGALKMHPVEPTTDELPPK